MKGLSQQSLRLNLHKVEPDSDDPASTITGWSEKLGDHAALYRDWYDESFNPAEKYYYFSREALSGFSYDEVCKLYYSTVICMDHSVDELFDKNAQYEIIRKIKNSMWRWGVSKGTWNQVVDAYNSIRHFTFINNPDFELKLDWATWHNEYGYSKFSRIYIDGAFAFLVYYKRKHVMTIGFSILDGRRVLIQQVQSKERTGNRWLYKLPKKNRLELVIDLFLCNFPGYELYVIDGGALADKCLRDYRKALDFNLKSRERWKNDPRSRSYLQKLEEERAELEMRLMHVKSDKSRIAAMYAETGCHRLDSQVHRFCRFPHYQVMAPSLAREGELIVEKSFGSADLHCFASGLRTDKIPFDGKRSPPDPSCGEHEIVHQHQL